MKTLKIDKEFQRLITPLKKEEYENLKQNILTEGCRDPIVVWNGLIVDGHNRYEICTENNIPFQTVSIELTDRSDVMIWMLKNQLGRRNLTDFQRNEMALKYEKVIADKMKQRQRKAGGDKVSEKAKSGVDQMIHSGQEESKTSKRRELTKMAGTSEGSIQRTKIILENGTEEQIKRAREGGRGNSISSISNEIKEKTDGKQHPVKKKEIIQQDDTSDFNMSAFEEDIKNALSGLYELIKSHKEQLAKQKNMDKLTKLMNDFSKMIEGLM